MKDSHIYENLKYYLLSKAGIASQVVRARTLQNQGNFAKIVKNLIVQISAKVSHSPWGFNDIPLTDRRIMVVGIDVCRKVSNSNRSVLTFVASINRTISKFYVDYTVKGEDQGYDFPLVTLFKNAISAFININKKPPQRIIVYRDAVSEGQAEETRKNEVDQLTKAIDDLLGEEVFRVPPQTLYILANKRIEQRFSIVIKVGREIQYKNPQKGIVIDETITRSDRFEFYMISHQGPTGLQTPIRYEVIHMNWDDLNPTDLYDLTNSLCYGYYNFHSSVKIPSPLMYAHVYCNYLSKICKNKPTVPPADPKLKNKLYFI